MRVGKPGGSIGGRVSLDGRGDDGRPLRRLGRRGGRNCRRLVVLRRQGPLLQLVLRRVRFGRALDVHEGDGTRQRALGRRPATPRTNTRPGTRAILRTSRQQLDTLDAAIPNQTREIH